MALPAGVSLGGRAAPSHPSSTGAPLATGVVELDQALPQGGFPRGAVSELCSPFGLGVQTSIALAACASAQLEARDEGKPAPWCAFLDPSASLHGPGVAAAGVELGRLLVARPPFESLARIASRLVASGAFAVVVVDTAGVPGSAGCASLAAWPTATRRLALAAEASSTVVLLLTDYDAVRPVALPVAMRVELQQPAPGRLSLRVAKERRGKVGGWSSFAWGAAGAAETPDIVPLRPKRQGDLLVRSPPPRALPMRVLAIVLPDLACELAALARESALGVAGALTLQAPLAVVVAGRAEGLGEGSRLSAVTARARRCGVFAGQRVAEAHALVADLDVRRVDPADVDAALARIAEMALAFGPVVSFEGPDTVWVDVTGTAHLVGGEEALVAQLCERVRSLGHRVRGAVASGPSVAQALARYSPVPQTVVPPGNDVQAFGPLPVRALPLDEDVLAWLLRLGVVTVGDLGRLPRGPLANRLGPLAARVLPLLAGDDRAALSPYHPPTSLSETIAWGEAPVEGGEPLLFALRGLLARLCARLEGRGEATRAVVVTLTLDREVDGERTRSLRVDLAAPLAHASDLMRVLRPKLEALTCPAPLCALTLEAAELARAPRPQLGLDGRSQAPEDIGVVLAELTAELGEKHVGVLAACNSHLPEECTRLVAPSLAEAPAGPRGAAAALLMWGNETRGVEPPTRLLPKPVPVRGKLVEGGTVSVNDTPFRVHRLERLERLENVNWWTDTSTSRDYARAWLVGSQGGAEAWLMRDRRKGGLYVHGWYV